MAWRGYAGGSEGSGAHASDFGEGDAVVVGEGVEGGISYSAVTEIESDLQCLARYSGVGDDSQQATPRPRLGERLKVDTAHRK